MSKHPFQLLRLSSIIIRYSLDDLFYFLPYARALKPLHYFNPLYWLCNRKLSRGKRLRLGLEKAGPVFIKFGQILSTRTDLLPADIIAELSKLRDQVPAFAFSKAKKIIEGEFKQPLETLFKEFSHQALASASVAQVHSAVLNDGQNVVVKVLRPNIKAKIISNLSLLSLGASFIEKFSKNAAQLKAHAMMAEIQQTLLNEVDLTKEAAHAEKLKEFSQQDASIYVPKIHWQLVAKKALVMEKIVGIPIAESAKLQDYGVDLTHLATITLEVFYGQIFRDRYFHADLHPGNIFINVTQPKHPIIEVVDFGIVGKLSEEDQRYLAKNIIALIDRDYMRVAQLHKQSGWIPDTVSTQAFAHAMQKVIEPVFDKPLSEISLGQLLLRLIEAAKQFHINVQPQLLLMQKTLLNIEGLCRNLDPNFNLWVTTKPIIEKWLKQQVGPKAFFKKMKDNLPLFIENAPDIPDALCQLLNNTKANKPAHAICKLCQHKSKTKKTRRLILLFLFALLLIQANYGALPLWLGNSLLITAIVVITFLLIFSRGDL
jgi:ubiquinone biosynthesis protein